jgi:hypothetical protein
MREKQQDDTQLDANLYAKMSRENLGKWMAGSGFSDIKIRNLLFLPGNMPLPIFVYRIINRLLQRIPYIRRFSIMHLTNGRNLGDAAHLT